MALPKGKLMALLAVFAAIGLITATGAFTTVTADRTADVALTGDASANLGLFPSPGSSNNAYAEVTDGTLELDLGDVNYDAKTEIVNVFTIQNNGNQTVSISLTKYDYAPTESDGLEGNQETGMVTFYVDDNNNDQFDSGEELDGRSLGSGNSLEVSIQIDSDGFVKGDDGDSGDGTDDILDELEITVTATS